jgi:type IV secretion system protein VirD4
MSYKTIRGMLQISTVAMLLVVFLIACMIGKVAFAVIAAATFYHIWKNQRVTHTAYGTAKWASESDLRRAGMINASSGLILGRIKSRGGWWSLFDKRISDKEACEKAVFARWAKDPLVRLSNAIHTVVYAPTGAGKNVSSITPFLLTCPDSCVVVDFKGELALLTAEYREREFGHTIVILDPFKVVTK